MLCMTTLLDIEQTLLQQMPHMLHNQRQEDITIDGRCQQFCRVARMVAADGLPSRTDCTVLATSQMDCSSEASPSALVEDTGSYDTKCVSCFCILLMPFR